MIVSKRTIVVLTLMFIFTFLSGTFSEHVSPNGHTYHPRYNQCQHYIQVPVTNQNIVISNSLIEPNISASIIYNAGSISFTIEDLNLSESFTIYLAGKEITDIIKDNDDVTFEQNLKPGTYNLEIEYTTIDPEEELPVEDGFAFSIELTHVDYYYENEYAKIFVRRDEANMPALDVVRPVLFVEGFQIPILMDSGNDYTEDLINEWSEGMSADAEIYRLSLNDPNQDLRNSAMIVLGALRFIHNHQSASLVEGTSVYGYSMGGILARYALAYAEHWNIAHYCTQYISIDAPHRGTAINYNLQGLAQEVIDYIDNLFISNFINLPIPSKISAIVDALKSPAAKQLLRANKYSAETNESNSCFVDGSPDYRGLFAEINEEENASLTGISILNGNIDTSYIGQIKPGFPYKQNRIKSLAYSNGALNQSGNINDNDVCADFDLSWSIPFYGENMHRTVRKCIYDAQPGSVIGDFSHQASGRISITHWNYTLQAYYSPVVVPTRSGLYLKTENVVDSNGVANDAFDIGEYGSLIQYENDLTNHTYFDKIEYATNVPNTDDFDLWNWTHGELDKPWVATNISSVNAWCNLEENRTICTISGQINIIDPDEGEFAGITAKMYINDRENRDIEIEDDGSFVIPYLYTHGANVRLIFKKDAYIDCRIDIPIEYAPSAQQNYVVNVIMFPISLNNIVVSATGEGPFTEIGAAVEYVGDYALSQCEDGETFDQPIRIIVRPGVYEESVNLSILPEAGITNFTLEGIGEVIIKGRNNSELGINLDLRTSCVPEINEGQYQIIGIKFEDFSTGVAYFNECFDTYGYGTFNVDIMLSISGCEFSNCGSDFFSGNIYLAGAIHIEAPALITNCIFTENFRYTHSDETIHDYANVGALYLYANSDEVIEVSQNEFTANRGGTSGGIIAQGKGEIIIKNNKFFDNYRSHFNLSSDQHRAHALSVFNSSNTVMRNNLFVDNYHRPSANGVVIAITSNQLFAEHPILFENNTIVNSPLYSDPGLIFLKFFVDLEQDIQIQNNVFSCPNDMGSSVICVSVAPPSIFRHNMFHNTILMGLDVILYNPHDPDDVYNPHVDYFNYECDPELNEHFQPIWDASTISPCIDAGYGIDEDGTPADIGAYATVNHRYWEYPFEDQADVERWHWVSYPILNTITDDALLAGNFFKDLLHVHKNSNYENIPTYLEEILWLVAGEYENSISWDDHVTGWYDDHFSHVVNSPQGYKIKMQRRANPNFPLPLVFRHSGFKTPNHTEFPIYGNRENWIGYFRDDSRMPEHAFASIWDDITMIKAKDWSLFRSGVPGGYLWTLTGRIMPLNPGDMVIVKTTQDHIFKWGDNIPVPPRTKSSPQGFVYDEKEDYIPVYITLTDEMVMQYEEVGLYVDGVCKGAVVVEENLEQISAYVASADDLANGEVELTFVPRASKSAASLPEVKRINHEQLIPKHTAAGAKYQFFEINLADSKEKEDIPALPSLEQNYPNPFNPNTTISYSMPTAGKVRLEVYNLKGQLVKILVDEEIDAGIYSVNWNGKDSSGKSVASGIYFYRFSTPGYKQSKKMLLMK